MNWYLKCLEIDIKYNDLLSYLEGFGHIDCTVDPRHPNAPYDFYGTLKAYHDFNREHPEYGLDKKYEQTILERLHEADIVPYDVYSIFESINCELLLEHREINSFNVSKEFLEESKNLLNVLYKNHEEALSKATFGYGDAYKNGTLGRMQRYNELYGRETGYKILQI